MTSPQRVFPNPTQDTLIAFIYHTNRIERIPMNKRTIDAALSQKESDPYVEGHLRAITLIQQLATDPGLIPDKVTTIFDFDNKFPWLRRIHRNVMRPVAEFGVMQLDTSYIHPTDVGVYRSSHKFLKRHDERGNLFQVNMPDPIFVRELLTEWAQDLCKFHNEYKGTIDYGRYTQDDVKLFVDKAYESNLKLCCIKPFEDGSNRVGRLIENLLRMNWGLPWKTINFDDKDQLLDDLREMQTRFSK